MNSAGRIARLSLIVAKGRHASAAAGVAAISSRQARLNNLSLHYESVPGVFDGAGLKMTADHSRQLGVMERSLSQEAQLASAQAVACAVALKRAGRRAAKQISVSKREALREARRSIVPSTKSRFL